ncbi:ribbon-helix-helix domain-containing protein [Microbacterium sp. NIBRBAC000506063]|uniref:ribbon-helix-helix domain-containing protein n=1 Tax=Microbacterium sp. NIBRBAC000506063 TaxID=2734618 RepID=UPI001BB4B3C0|nr:ribbon-helix-helix domain-containing protein [Microbacterium sp. NIBRBAC000506063]QTV79768.1 hypothetical protein KAE78_00230 [Microbacterium sp. NIBRBAC000506063]
MSTQIAVRLPEQLVAQMDDLVAAGAVTSRTALVSSAIERELRRRVAERDAAILRAQGANDDLDALVDWTMGRIEIEADDA